MHKIKGARTKFSTKFSINDFLRQQLSSPTRDEGIYITLGRQRTRCHSPLNTTKCRHNHPEMGKGSARAALGSLEKSCWVAIFAGMGSLFSLIFFMVLGSQLALDGPSRTPLRYGSRPSYLHTSLNHRPQSAFACIQCTHSCVIP